MLDKRALLCMGFDFSYIVRIELKTFGFGGTCRVGSLFYIGRMARKRRDER